MNIAIFTHNYPKYKKDRKDAGIFVHDFANELKKHHQVFIFCPDYGNDKKFSNWSIFNPLSAVNFFKNVFFGIRESLKFVEKNKIDYILCAWAIPSGIYGLVSKFKHGTSYGVWYLGSDLNIYSKIPILSTIIHFISIRADHLFANSYALAKIASHKYKKCLMLPASTKLKDVINTTKKIKLNNKKVNILFVGRLEKVKGPDLLVEAAKKVNSKFVINVVGDGTMRNNLEKNRSSNVNFLGYLDLYEMTSYMKASDFLIIPSRNESLPLVILEAANYKLPVLASDVGDCKYVLTKYKIGETFKPGDVNQIIKKINNFKYKQYRLKGKFKLAVNDYGLESSVRKFLNQIS
jgi:glycosyltransferase involved in cell wall biosynthesis